MSAPDRIPCSVPFCRRTTPAGRFREWLCPRHWALVPADLKARKRKVERLRSFAFARDENEGARRNLGLKFCGHADRVWHRCKAKAIERAAGIA